MSSSSTLVDSCPPTGLPFLFDLLLQFFVSASIRKFVWILIHIRVSPFLLSAWCPRDQTRYPSRSPLLTLVHLRVSPFFIIGFLVLVGFVGCLCCFQRLLNPILSSNNLDRNSSVVVEVTHILSRIWFLQFPSQQLSRYYKLGVYRKGWLHYILFDRTSITSSACTMQDVVWSNQAHTDLCDPCAWDSQP